ncbi:MAG: hypothetical protein H6Q58_1316 [Firmicutes bacterium]|nr:hypothetical protein [Bacillota bacterium]
MKIFKTITIWAMLSLVLQMSGFFYVNNYFLSDETNIKVSKLVKNTDEKKEAEVFVPEEAENISASYNGRYMAYYDSDVLKIVTMSTGEEKTVEFDEDVEVSYYRWLSDRNRMLIAEKHKTSSGINFELSYYDVDKDTKDAIETLTWAGKNAEVSDIEASPLTNLIFIKVALNDYTSSIYSLNIMEDKKKVSTVVDTIGNIGIVPHVDKLYYEDAANSRVYATGSKNRITVGNAEKTTLLSVDNNDNVYIGELAVDNTVVRIYYGQAGADTSTYSLVELASSYFREDICISNDGKIYLNDNLKGTITDSATGKEYVYPGIFIQIYDGGIMSLSENQVMKTTFSDDNILSKE